MVGPPTGSRSDISELVSTWFINFKNNTSATIARLGPRDYIRLVVLIGGYLLLRPYLMQLGAKLQARQHEKDNDLTPEQLAAQDLRGRRAKVDIPGVEDESEEEDGEPTSGNWGTRARRRQRDYIREKLEAEERRLHEDDDKDIDEFLVD